MSRNALGNLANRYRAVLRKCHLLNAFGTLLLAGSCICGTTLYATAADVDGTGNGGKVTINGGTYDTVTGFAEEHYNNSGTIIGDATSNAVASGANVSISNGAVISGNIYGGLASNYAPFISENLGDATSNNNTVSITGSQVAGQVFGGLAQSSNNGLSGNVESSNNNVIITDSTLSDLAVGGYTARMHGEGISRVTGNSVTVSHSTTRSIYGGYLGTTLSNTEASTTEIANNRVTIDNNSVIGTADKSAYIMGGYVNYSEYSQNTVMSFGNTVRMSQSTAYVSIYGSHVRGLFERQASGGLASFSTDNHVTVENSTIHLPQKGGIWGAFGYDDADAFHNAHVTVELSDNSVTLTQTSVHGDPTKTSAIYGAQGLAKSTHNSAHISVHGNTLSVQASQLTDVNIFGGAASSSSRKWGDGNAQAGDAEALANTVLLTDATVTNGTIYGGYALSQGGEPGKIPATSGNATASGNIIIITGGKIQGDVYGGHAEALNADTSGALLPNPAATVIANDNRIILRGTADMSLANLYGSNLANARTTGNTLEIDGWKGSVASINNFNTLTFKNIAWENGGTVLAIANSTDALKNTNVSLVSLRGGATLHAGDSMYMVKGEQPLGTDASRINTAGSFIAGVAIEGTGTIEVEENGNIRFDISGTRPTEQTNRGQAHGAGSGLSE